MSKIFEDFFDDIDSEEIVDNSVEDTKPVDDYQHYIEYCFSYPQTKKAIVKGYNSLIKKYLTRFFEVNRYITDFKIGFVIPLNTVDGEKEYEWYDNLTELDEQHYHIQFIDVYIRVLFDTNKNISIKGMMNMFINFFKVYQYLSNYTDLRFSRFFYIDGNYNFTYSNEEYESIAKQCWFSPNAKKHIKHFIRVFNKAKKLQYELEQYFDATANFRGSGEKSIDFIASFLSEEDYKKCTIITQIDDKPIVVIPKNKEVHIHCLDKIQFYVKVEGKLVLHKGLHKRDSYNWNNNKTLFKKFVNTEHNDIKIIVRFSDSPYFMPISASSSNTATIDFDNKHINSLEIVCDDKFIDDIDELKEYLLINNTSNIKDIKWNLEERDE